MKRSMYGHEKDGVFSSDFCLELVQNSPDQAFQMVGIFKDGTLTCQATHAWVAILKETFGLDGLQEGRAVLVSPNVIAVSVGSPKTRTEWQELGAKLLQHVPSNREGALMVDGLDQENMLHVAYGCEMGSWRFNHYRTKARPAPARCVKAYVVHPAANEAEVKKQRLLDHHLVQSVHWARDMANQPGNIIYPETFAQRVKEFNKIGINVEVLEEHQLTGWGALLGVSQGSAQSARVVVASWQGAGKDDPVVALVGKGVTFDSGGLSLKPANSMEEMKLDKTGAVVVSGVVRALALQKAPVNVVAVLALVENMPSDRAQRPGDIVTSLSGQTIEVLNTDAEGRLILADALTYTQTRFNPAIMVDVATLTGAVIVALGSAYAGLFTHDDALAQQLIDAGEKTGEALWRLPMHKKYDEAMNSDCADMKNISGSGVGAGSATAAAFLGRFVNANQAWAHLDIAGVDMASKATPLHPRGGIAFGVQLLSEFTHQAFQNQFVHTALGQKEGKIHAKKQKNFEHPLA
jgi:leucyl aminopeptidase